MLNIFSDLKSLGLITLGFLVIVAMVTDLKSQRIPNKLTFSAAVIGILLNSWLTGVGGLIFSLQGLMFGLVIFIVPYIIGKVGAGDAKLMGAVGAFIGLRGVFIAFIYIAIAGGIYSLFIILSHRKQFKGFFREQYINALVFQVTKKLDLENKQKKGRPRLCYGLAIAAGTWIYIGIALFGANQLIPL